MEDLSEDPWVRLFKVLIRRSVFRITGRRLQPKGLSVPLNSTPLLSSKRQVAMTRPGYFGKVYHSYSVIAC